MIRFEVTADHVLIEQFRVTGHAGFADAGQDIVCAAVSVLVYNAVNSCEELLGMTLTVTDTRDALLCCVPHKVRSDERVQLLLRSMAFGIEQVAENYPKFVRVHYRTGTE